jgi:hypothetical protein
VTEPEFVLIDEPAPAPGDLQLRPLKRAGRHGIQKSVLIRLDGYPRRHRLLLLALVAVAAGAAAFVVVKRRRSSRDDRAEQSPLVDDDALAMREPPIVAVP